MLQQILQLRERPVGVSPRFRDSLIRSLPRGSGTSGPFAVQGYDWQGQQQFILNQFAEVHPAIVGGNRVESVRHEPGIVVASDEGQHRLGTQRLLERPEGSLWAAPE